MYRHLGKPGPVLGLLFPADIFGFDKVQNVTETEKQADLSVLETETGWDRLKRIFEIDEFGNLSKEVETTLNVGGMSIFMGALYGGVINSRLAYMDFIKNNQATAFNDHIEAKKRLQEAVMKSFGRGAWKWSWRLSLFCTTFMGVSTTISVYRGKSSIWEYVIAGFASGSLYKFNIGPRGWIVGGGLGAALGLIGGSVTVALLSATGMSMDDVRYWQHRWKTQRVEYFNKGATDYLAKEEGELTEFHKKKVADIEKTLDNV